LEAAPLFPGEKQREWAGEGRDWGELRGKGEGKGGEYVDFARF